MRKDKKRSLKRPIQVVLSSVVAIIIITALVYVTRGRDIPVLNPHGIIADQERNLILLTVGLGLLVVVPVFIMLFTIAWRYRASNTKAVYQPDFSSHKGFEALWWGLPCLIILTLAIITGIYTHALDPFKPIDSQVKPVTIQVISLQWKWLFIYPDQKIATLNYVDIPKDTPINFMISSDAPMNSFWIPALAGQVYAMSGMSTQLHLMSNSVGSYVGTSANISGDGFADMHFKVNSMSESDFATWTQKAAVSTSSLANTDYKKLAEPSHDSSEATYKLTDASLYNEVIMKYTSPGGSM
ncbi:ubiquinol oxidase subunit II [Patescibacteria group bacterium]|nr:MAG: ubiquinol oxidase subunit II [Patescibacteria group bacterium]